MQKALDAKLPEPTAMTVASMSDDGRLSARTVLLKHYDQNGFVFYTNLNSNKGQQLLSNPRIAATIHWREIEQQVLIEGTAMRVTDTEADAYFATRARGSQIGAWASLQSEPLDTRATFESRIENYEQQFANQQVPRPPHWSGFRIVPDMVEFWYGQDYRLHDRFRWCLGDSGWNQQRLYP